jgi:ATP-dependent RNA helicase RhlE
VWHVAQGGKPALVQRILSEDHGRRAIVFTRTKRGANRLCDHLVRSGFPAGVIHGNKSQGARERVLEAFRHGTTRVLVATDIAARGIDVQDVGLVVNYDLPNVAESYVHRIGRTGRAGNTGAAVSFCDQSERSLLTDIERLLRFRIPVMGHEAGRPEAQRGPRVEPTPSAQTSTARPEARESASPHQTRRRRYRGTPRRTYGH